MADPWNISGLRSFWSVARPPGPRRPQREDIALLAALLGVLAFEVAVRPALSWSTPAVLVCVAQLAVVPWRRAHPLAAILLGFAASIGLDVARVLGVEVQATNTMAFLLLLPHALLRWGSGRTVVVGTAWLLLAVSVSLLLQPRSWTDVVGAFAVVGVSLAVGAAARYRDTAHAQEIEQVALREREALARELHDTVAHHVSAIAIQAQAGLAVAKHNPDAAADTLAVIAAEASRTLAEMRAMVRVLRHDGSPELAPGPRAVDLPQLAEAGGPGPEVSVTLSGDVAGLPGTTSAAIYRLAQESITNARRHARGATRVSVSVSVSVAPPGVRLRVEDDGAPVAAPSRSPRGYGLRGMAERAALLGGQLRAGPGPERGWVVTATLPTTQEPL